MSDKTVYPVTFPTTLCGATMRIVLPEKPKVSMVNGYVHEIIGDDYFPCSFGLSYPCNREYWLEMGPIRFNSCSKNDSVHGHILLQGDDGTAKLPHCIHSKADVIQALRDIEEYRLFDVYLGNTKSWVEALEYIYEHDPVIQALPDTSSEKSKSFDLTKVGWWS